MVRFTLRSVFHKPLMKILSTELYDGMTWNGYFRSSESHILPIYYFSLSRDSNLQPQADALNHSHSE